MFLLTSLMEQDILLRYIASYPTLEVQYSEILSGGVDFISLIQRVHLVVHTGQLSGRLNDKNVSQVRVL